MIEQVSFLLATFALTALILGVGRFASRRLGWEGPLAVCICVSIQWVIFFIVMGRVLGRSFAASQLLGLGILIAVVTSVSVWLGDRILPRSRVIFPSLLSLTSITIWKGLVWVLPLVHMANDPRPAMRVVKSDSSRTAVSEVIRRSFLNYFRSFGDSPEAMQAAEVLEKEEVKIFLSSKADWSPRLYAVFDFESSSIWIGYEAVGLNPMTVPNEPLVPEGFQIPSYFLERNAGTILHELSHARDALAGCRIAAVEAEVVAYFDETAFEVHRARVGRQPQSMAMLNGLIRKPWCQPWWSCRIEKAADLKSFHSTISPEQSFLYQIEIWEMERGMTLLAGWKPFVHRIRDIMRTKPSIFDSNEQVLKGIADQLRQLDDVARTGTPGTEGQPISSGIKMQAEHWSSAAHIASCQRLFEKRLDEAEKKANDLMRAQAGRSTSPSSTDILR